MFLFLAEVKAVEPLKVSTWNIRYDNPKDKNISRIKRNEFVLI
jgi:hypothetical protein